MLFLLFGAIAMFVMSAVFFRMHVEFLRRDGILPPQVLYRKNVFGVDEKAEILWKTKPLTGWDDESKGFARFGMFVAKWGFCIGGWFMFAGFLTHLLGPK